MLKKISLIIILILGIQCMEVPDRLKNICVDGCKRYFYCDEKAKKCVFKGFFPLYPLELIELFVLMISSSLATSCGIGGGTVYSSMILGVEELEPSQAFPVSNFLILFCGLFTFISFTLDKYQHPKNLFIHYDVATIFSPSMLVGAKFGTILNKILPSSLLLIFLCFLICYTTRKTYYNILKAKAKEAKLNEKEKYSEENKNNNLLVAFKEMQSNNNNSEIKINDEENNFSKKISSIITQENYDNQDRIEFSGLSKIEGDDNLRSRRIYSDEDLKIINEDDDPLNWGRINYICFLIYVSITLYFVRYSIDMVYAHIQRKKNLIPDFKSEVIDNIEKNLSYVVGIGIFAGIVSSSLGIGGGMITNPAFSSLGMDPKQISSTSNFLIIITAIASSFIFILSGQLIIGYSICLGTFCTAAALIGSFYILKYINQTGRSSILLVIMEYFLIASLFIALYKLFTLDLKGHSFIGSLFVTNKFC